MAAWHVLWALIGLILTTVQTPSTGEGTPETIPVKPVLLENQEGAAARPDAVTVVTDDVVKALELLRPGMVVLSPERYRELVELARQQKIAPADGRDAVPMSICRFMGELERDAAGKLLLKLRILLEFRTDTEDTVVPLGFRGVRFTKALLDGEPPVWAHDGDGLAVRVKEPKARRLELETTVPVLASGAGRRVVIERIPPAAITSMDITVPERVQTATVKNAGPVTPTAADGQQTRLRAEALGVLRELELTWLPVAPATPTVPVQLAVLGDQRVHLGQAIIQTEARVRMEVRQGAVSLLRFRLGPDVKPVDVTLLPSPDDSLGTSPEWTFDHATGLLAVALKQPLTPADPTHHLRVRWQQPAVAKPVGPSSIVCLDLVEPAGATQTGTISFWTSPGIQASFQHDLLVISPQEIPVREERAPAYACRYWQQPVKLQAVFDRAPMVSPAVEVRMRHVLRLAGENLALSSELDIQPKSGAGVQELELSWPKGFSVDRRIVLTNLVEGLDQLNGTLRLTLASRTQERFTLKLEGNLAAAAGPSLSLDLPAVLRVSGERAGQKEAAQLIFRSGEVSLSVEGAEAWLQEGTTGLRQEQGGTPALEVPLRPQSNYQLEMPGNDRPWRIVLAWQPLRHEVASSASCYITEHEVQIRQVLSCRFAGGTPGFLWLRVPRAIEKSLKARCLYRTREGKQSDEPADLIERPRQSDARMVERALVIPSDVSGHLEVHIEVRVPRQGLMNAELLSIPLLGPSPGEWLDKGSEVRCWIGAGLKVRLRAEDTVWQAARLARRPGHATAPTLEMRSGLSEAPLEVACSSAAVGDASIVCERMLIEAKALPGGRLDCRVSFILNRVRTEHVEVLLPARPQSLTIQRLVLDDQELPVEMAEPAQYTEKPEFTVLRIPLEPSHLSRPALLEVKYRLEDIGPGWLRLMATLPAPQLAGASMIGASRWCVEWPADMLVIPQAGATPPEQPWSWWGWLRAPRAELLGAPLRSWLRGGPVIDTNPDRQPALSYFQAAEPAALAVLTLPVRTWMLTCSLVVLLVGLWAYAYPPKRIWFWLGFGVIGLLFMVVWNPELLLACAFAAQPGLAVLALCLGFLWTWQRRWRRQIVLMPGFRRRPTGSSLVHPSAGRPVAREPSTTDGSRPPQSLTVEQAP
jgi:hypothetical protein